MTRGLPEGSTTSFQRGMMAPVDSSVSARYAAINAAHLAQDRLAAQAVADQQAEQQWRDTHIQLDTGEWVDKGFFDSLRPDQRVYLKAAGVDKYNRRDQDTQAQLAPYTHDGALDVNAAVTAGKLDALQVAGVSEADIREIQQFHNDNIKVGNDWISKADYRQLTPAEQARLATVGLTQFQAEMAQEAASAQAQAADIRAVSEKMAGYQSGEGYAYIQAVADNRVSVDDLIRTGFIGESQRVETERQAQEWARRQAALPRISRYQSGDGNYDLQAIYADHALSPGDIVLLFGPQPGDSPEVSAEKRQALQDAIRAATEQRQAQVVMQDSPTSYKRAQKAAGIARTYLDYTLPVYGTQRHWHEMNNWNRALSIACDAAMLIPIVGAAGKGARAVTVAERGGAAAARASRMKGAAKAAFELGIKSEGKGLAGKSLQVGEFWRSVAWPAELTGEVAGLAKPLTVTTTEGGKAVAKTYTGASAVARRAKLAGATMIERTKAMASPVETLLRPTSKLSESVVTTAYHTVKFPIGIFESPEAARAARDALMKAAAKPGNHLRIETGEYIIELRRGKLMEKIGGLATGTPQGENFVDGLIVKWKPGKSWEEQGLFFSFEPLGRFVGSTSGGAGGEMASWVIVSPELAARMQQGQKTYRGTYELERLLKPGGEVPEAAQRLFTRLGDTGQRVEIFLPKKLSRVEILKLNAWGLVESLRNLYTPSVTLTGREWIGLTGEEVRTLVSEAGRRSPSLASRLEDTIRAGRGIDATDAKALYASLARTDADAAQALADAASRTRPLTKAEARKVASILSDRSPQMGRNLMAVATDNGDLLRAARVREEPPDVYRMVSPRLSSGKVRVERVTPRRGESTEQLIRRVESRQEQRAARLARQSAPARTAARASGSRAEARMESPRAETARVEAPRLEAPRVGAPRVGAPRLEAPRVESPALRAPQGKAGSPKGKTALVRIPWLPDFEGSEHEAGLLKAASVAFRMGELGGKSVWWILYPPTYGVDAGPGEGEGKVSWVNEEPPEGVKVESGPRSAYRTIQAMGKVAPATIKGSVGFSRYKISHGSHIKFKKPKARLSR